MKVGERLADGEFSYSFEFFPPKNDEGEVLLWRAIEELQELHPTFVSCTDGAGGSTRERTARIVTRIARETDITAVAHLTCVGSTRDELRTAVESYGEAGIENIMALRGDAPRGAEGFVATQGGLSHAVELVELIHQVGDFCVGVAGYPEAHPEAPDFDTDVGHLVDKVRMGADLVVTQFFFQSDHYFRLLGALHKRGIAVPVIPGIMPITSVKGITRMAELQGSAFPEALAGRLYEVEDDPDAVRAVGVEVATELCLELIEGGAPGLHFYTLNRSTATTEIAANIGLGANT